MMYGLTLSGGNENAGHMTASNSKKENEYTLQSVNNDIKCDSSSGCLGYGEYKCKVCFQRSFRTVLRMG